jgi:uncharacterized membrane protein YfcA
VDSLYLVVALGAALAGFVQGLSGFAFALVAMSVWAWMLEPQLASALAVCGGLSGQILSAVTVRRGFDVKLLLPFVAGGLVGIPVGTLLLPMLDVTLFKVVLGGVLVVLCPVMLAAQHLPRIDIRHPLAARLADAGIGLVGGTLGGIGGFSGVVPTLWCTLRGMNKDTQRSVIQNFNLALLMVTMLGYVATGIVTLQTVPFLLVVIPAMLVPSLLGAKLYIGISDAVFRRIVLGLLTLSGLAMLASALPKVL